MTTARDTALRCPSAQPGMAELQVLGVVSGAPDAPRIAYLNAHLPAMRRCLHRPRHFPRPASCASPALARNASARISTAPNCQLATRIVRILDEVVDALPRCAIRPTCRWYAQEGRPACLRCPQVVTELTGPDERLRAVALPRDGDEQQ
jgi:hypothetical protein